MSTHRCIKYFATTLFLSLLWIGPVQAQEKAKNLLFLELGGNGLLYSLNYDRMLTDNISGRLGFMYVSVSGSGTTGSASVSLVTLPVMGNYLVGSSNHKLELGAGAVLVFVSAEFKDVASFSGAGVGATATVGYRYQPSDGGFSFRIGYTPFIGKGGFASWGGISFGYAF